MTDQEKAWAKQNNKSIIITLVLIVSFIVAMIVLFFVDKSNNVLLPLVEPYL